MLDSRLRTAGMTAIQCAFYYETLQAPWTMLPRGLPTDFRGREP
jgi:hypothetical protein